MVKILNIPEHRLFSQHFIRPMKQLHPDRLFKKIFWIDNIIDSWYISYMS